MASSNVDFRNEPKDEDEVGKESCRLTLKASTPPGNGRQELPSPFVS